MFRPATQPNSSRLAGGLLPYTYIDCLVELVDMLLAACDHDSTIMVGGARATRIDKIHARARILVGHGDRFHRAVTAGPSLSL